MAPLKFHSRKPEEAAVVQAAPVAEVLDQAALAVPVQVGILGRAEDPRVPGRHDRRRR